MSILYIILFILLAIGAIFSMGITLVIDVVLFGVYLEANWLLQQNQEANILL